MSSVLYNPYSARPALSIVSPVYQAENLVDDLVAALLTEAAKVTDDYEIILVEDGSPDHSWKKIENHCFRNPRIKGIKFSRNFGQHSAITAGLKASTGEFVIVIDCDLQDDPRYISALYEKAREGFDVVFTSKSVRQHSFVKNITARLFFYIFNWLSDSKQAQANVGSYSLISRKVVDAFCKIEDAHRHYLMLLRWLGFSSTCIDVDHRKRPRGQSSYTWRRLISHAINGITAHSDRLLKLSVGIGFFYCVAAIFSILYLIVLYYIQGYKEGWASTIVLLLFSTGIILMSIGVAGIYIGKIFDQVKNRPLFLIDTTVNLNLASASDGLEAPEKSHNRL